MPANEHEGDSGLTAPTLRQQVEGDDDLVQGDDGDYVRLPRAVLKQLRQAAKGSKAAQEGQQKLEQDNLLLRAGIDPDTEDPKIQTFVRGYQGELTPEAIRAAAVEFGVLTAYSEVPVAELAAHSRMVEASSGVDGYVPPEPSLIEKINASGSPDEIMHHLTKAGVPTTWNRG